MNADRLLAHYHRVADTADAIDRLRRFILDLAVRGKLVPQDPNDESASVLFERLMSSKGNDSHANKKQAAVTSIEGADIPFSVPVGWLWLRFGSIHDLVRGVTYTKSDVAETQLAGHLPILRANNIGTSLNFDELVFVRKKCISPDQMLHRGDYLIALSSGSKNLVGKAAFVAADYKGGFGGFCGVIRVLSPCLEQFVGVFLSSRLYRDAISAGSRGIGINNLKRETLNEILFPLPPLAEQNRIVAKVDELMALCDRLEAARAAREATRDRLEAASLARLSAPDPDTFRDDARFALDALPTITTRPYQIRQIRQTILNLAMRGMLVPQDPTDEPASELLKRIAAEKARLAKTGEFRKNKPLSPIPEEALPFKLPSGWAWERLGNIGETNIGLTYSPQDISETGIPVLRSSNIQNGKLDFSDLVRVKDEPKQSVMVQQGDLLICARNGSRALVGKVAVIQDLKEPAAFGAFMAIFRSEVNQYLYHFICSPLFRQLIAEVNTTTINQITQNNLRSTLVPLPALAEQHRIVAKVEELMALCDRLEASLTIADESRSRLLDSLLVEALAQDAARELEAAE